jgi:flagellar hook-associated protein 3 FlgL
MRISENTMVQEYLRNLEDARLRWYEWNRRVSTGKRIHAPSDAPADSARLVRIQDEVSRINQYFRNVSRAGVKLGNASSTLNSLRNAVIQASERTIFALNGTTSEESRRAIAHDLRGLLEGIVQLASTSVDGLYLFSGSRVDQNPMQREADGTYTYRGDEVGLEIEISEGERVRVNVAGTEVFLAPGADLINTLKALIDQLENSDIDGATLSLEALQEAGRVIDRARFSIGYGLQKIEAAQARLESRLLDLTSEVSRLEDANMAEAISRMVQSETALSASLGAGARMRQGNLFDYLG